MPESSAVEDSIKHCIKKNGFPDKTVRLPFKAIHESCKNHNTALKDVLANLVPDKIVGTIQGDFIEFRSSDKPLKKINVASQANDSSWGNLPNMDNLKDMAQSYMSKMNPEQIKEMLKTAANMSAEEKKKILKTFSQQFSKDKP